MSLIASGRVVKTRLRWVSAKEPLKISQFFMKLKQRVQIYDIVYAEGRWFCWFVPGDIDPDIKSVDL